jgi:hypothetical protein
MAFYIYTKQAVQLLFMKCSWAYKENIKQTKHAESVM